MLPADEHRASRFHGATDAKTPPDHRADYQRDRDRLLYSEALRRLGGITQVVSAAEGHVFHNRLTHTLKVAQLARRMAERLIDTVADEMLHAVGGLDTEAAEAAALAHDLGHPPFGHIAETELDSLVRDRDNPEGFEGNAQSFRIVNSLALRGGDAPGLNLTRATLRGVLKYPRLRELQGDGTPAGTPAGSKWGAYRDTEADVFAWVMEDAEPDVRSAEAEVMDWADDITYAVHDLVDFYRAGLIPLDRLLAEPEERDRFLFDVHQRRPGRFDAGEAADALKEAVGLFPVEPYSGTRDQQRDVARMSTALINQFVSGLTLEEPTPEVVSIDDELRLRADLLKELTWTYVITKPALASQQFGQRRVVRELYKLYFRAAAVPGEQALLPPAFVDLVDSVEPSRLAADVVTTLTEQESVAMYRRVMGIESGSVMDPIVGHH